MGIKGKIIKVMPIQTGVSKSGKEWKKQEYVLETLDRYPKKIAFTVMNDNIEKFSLLVGPVYDIEIDVESREYEGKWYHSVTGWRVNQQS